MTGRRAPLRLRSQGGYTVIEMIITMALTGIMSGAIFSSFVVLDRVQTAWQERDQARAVGVLAEQPLLRDVQAYRVTSTKWNSSSGTALVLQGSSTNGTPLQVVYTVELPSGKLVRTVTPCLESTCDSTVAHGVRSMLVTCSGKPPSIAVRMTLDAISTTSSQPVDVSPALKLTPRNLQSCPP